MCLVVLAWNALADRRLVLVGHRDEFYARDTAPMHWWRDPRILAGQDRVAGGTWFGIDETGRFGVVTNLRGAAAPPAAPSRGTLIPRFLADRRSASSFLEALAEERHRYAGFSLILGDDRELAYLSNGDPRGPQLLLPGVHALSNGPLGAEWPKVRRARDRLTGRLSRDVPLDDPEPLLELLAERAPAPDAELPDTGIGLELERRLSAAFIVGEDYGTRAATAVVLGTDGRGLVVERGHGPGGRADSTRRFPLGAASS